MQGLLRQMHEFIYTFYKFLNTSISHSYVTFFHRSQLFEDRNVQNISNSDFVFGENMVERVLVRSVIAGRCLILEG